MQISYHSVLTKIQKLQKYKKKKKKKRSLFLYQPVRLVLAKTHEIGQYDWYFNQYEMLTFWY